MSKVVVQVENLKKTYDGENYVLDGVQFEAYEGELVIIKGKSGSGKSTLLNILGLLDVFDSGSYKLNDLSINAKDYHKYSDLRGKFLGFIFQSYHLMDSISIRDNILLPYLYLDEPIDTSVTERMKEILQEFHLLKLLQKKVSLLSGGEKQRVAIARAIIKNPAVIIADEPTGNLDSENSSIVINYLKKLTQQNTTVILVTHDMNMMKYGDRTYSLEEGKLVAL